MAFRVALALCDRDQCDCSRTGFSRRRFLNGCYQSGMHSDAIARPVIYKLVGCCEGERRVIERTEDGFAGRDQETVAANDWLQSRPP